MKLRINKNILWIAFGQLVNLIFNFALLKLLTNKLPLENFGFYSIWLSVLLFLRQVIYDPFSVVAAKEAAYDKKEISSLDFFKILNHASDTAFKAILIIWFIIIILNFIIFNDKNYYIYLSLGLIYLVSNGVQGVYVNILNSLKRRRDAARIIAIDGLLKFLLVMLLLKGFGNDLTLVLLGVALSAVFLYTCIRINYSCFWKTTTLGTISYSIKSNELLRTTYPLVLPMSLVALKSSIDKWFMASIVGVEEVAVYSVLLQLGFVPMVLIVGVMQTYLSPAIYKMTEHDGVKERKIIVAYVNKILAWTAIFSLFPIIFSYEFSSKIVEMVSNSEYTIYSDLLPLFVVSGVVFALSNIANVVVIGLFNSKIVGSLMLLNVVISLIIIFALTYYYGLYGGTLGLLFSSFLSLAIYYFSIIYRRIE